MASWYPSTLQPATGSYIRDSVQLLKRTGHNVGVIAPHLVSLRKAPQVLCKMGLIGKEARIDREPAPTMRSFGVRWLPGVPMGNALLWAVHAKLLYQEYVDRFGIPDIILCHSAAFAGFAASLIARRNNVPYAIVEHSSAYLDRKVPWLPNDPAARYAFQRATAICAVSEVLANKLRRLFPGAVGKVHILPNFVPEDFIAAGSTGVNTRKKRREFVSVGALTKNKRHKLIVEAFINAFGAREPIGLSIAGDGPERDAIERLVTIRDRGDQVRILGSLKRNKVARLLDRADYYVVASRVETFGVAVIEAQAFGLPVISTRCGGPEEILDDETAVFVEAEVDDLANAMQLVAKKERVFDRDEIKARVRRRFSEEQHMRSMSSLLELLTARC